MPTCSRSPCASRRARGRGGSVRPASRTWPFDGSASTRAANHAAPGDRAGSRCTSSNTRHTAVGLRRQTASATASGRGAGVGGAGAEPASGGTGVVQGGERVPGERIAVGVARLDPDPHVVAAGRQAVLGEGLRQQRRLPQTGPADHRRHAVLPAPQQGSQQARSGERRQPRAGGLEPERARHPAGRLVTRHVGWLRRSGGSPRRWSARHRARSAGAPPAGGGRGVRRRPIHASGGPPGP